MGTRFPVGVRINDGVTDRHVTAAVTELRWKRTAPGGFHSASMKVALDPETFSDLGPADRIYVYGPNAETLWEGFIDNPGRNGGDEGVSLELSAMGTLTLGSDQARALPYLERDLDDWSQNLASATATSATASASDDPMATAGGDVDQGLLCQFNPGQPIGAGSVAQIGYSAIANADMELGVIKLSFKSGKIDADYNNDLITSAGTGTAQTLSLGSISTTSASVVRYAGAAGSFPVGRTRLAVQLRRTGAATNVADDNTWSWFYDVAVAARRVDVNGILLDATAMQAQGGATNVRADHIAADLVGRLLAVCDPAAVSIEAATYLIDQLSYTDPVTAADVLDDLETYEPNFLWEFGSSTSNGYSFTYRAWPTTVRYEISTRDGYEAPGGEFDLCNRVIVYWTDRRGKDRATVVTATSTQYPALKALEDAGRTRDAEPITLPPGRGSAANAQRAGQELLALKADPPKAATATIRRPIMDLLRGGPVMPYEIEPGYLVRVRETSDVLRLTEVEVIDDDGLAVLVLGEPVLEEDQRIARLEKVTRRR